MNNYPRTQCCNYSTPTDLPYPVYWNPYNKVIQCHNCGHVYIPKDNISSEREVIDVTWEEVVTVKFK